MRVRLRQSWRLAASVARAVSGAVSGSLAPPARPERPAGRPRRPENDPRGARADSGARRVPGPHSFVKPGAHGPVCKKTRQ